MNGCGNNDSLLQLVHRITVETLLTRHEHRGSASATTSLSIRHDTQQLLAHLARTVEKSIRAVYGWRFSVAKESIRSSGVGWSRRRRKHSRSVGQWAGNGMKLSVISSSTWTKQRILVMSDYASPTRSTCSEVKCELNSYGVLPRSIS